MTYKLFHITYFFLDLDQICGTWKNKYHAASTLNPIQNIRLRTMYERIHFTKYLRGQEGCYAYDWKRLLRNLEFENAETDRLHKCYGHIDNMIACVDISENTLDGKILKMLEELENIKGGELCWIQLKAALERIFRTDCTDAFEKWFIRKSTWG